MPGDRRRQGGAHRRLSPDDDLAHTLHGSVQSAFIVLEARLGSVLPRLGEREADEVGAIVQDLARLRDGEIRTLSAALALKHGGASELAVRSRPRDERSR
ncbi:hypothetical protein RYJ27_07345 [Microbacterium limosum]|uniref:Uncharacterized protein n=1 Tax=Microbacterium limosum TaxID=3079935 RepID=A0AAU0ME78_9MICO|nr:hypothetical protein [Microbacterium sp. Y20]WOQ68548.1 hypothetical protein RYJ27_07345 [Microbacterium sp. Y20]